MGSHYRWLALMAVAALLSGFLLLGGCSSSTSPEEVLEVLGVEGYSQADGTVTIDMGDFGTFTVQFCDALSGGGVPNVKCIAVAHNEKSDVIYVGVGDATKMPRFTGRPKSEVLGEIGMSPPGCDDIHPWIGVDNPVTGIHGTASMPGWAWEEFACSRLDLATDTVADLGSRRGNIATALQPFLPGAIMAVVFPADSDEVIIFECYAEASTLDDLLNDLETSVYELQGYCPEQVLRLVNLKGLCGGDISLGMPIILPVDDGPNCSSTEQPGELYGFVYNANTGLGVEDAEVVVNGVSETTGADGSFTVSDIIAGDGIPLTVMADGYLPYSTTVNVAAGSSTQQDLTIVPIVQTDEYRFVLTWGEQPQDLDSHFWVPIGASTYYHVYWLDKGSLVAEPYAQLDVDDVVSFGPETITALPHYTGEYHYAVHEFDGTGTLATSDAVVRVYSGNSLIRTLEAPNASCGENWYWYVGTVNTQTGVFTEVNTYQSGPPIAPFDYTRHSK